VRSCHLPPQFAGADAFLRRPQDRPRAWNTPVTPLYHAKIRATPSALNAPLPPRRDWLRNWLALLALLAIGIV
jgi:hypothetical protein